VICGSAVPGLSREVLPGGLFACATHIGPHAAIGLTGHALLTWCAERGEVPLGSVREVYLTNPMKTAPAQLVTELMLHVEDHTS
jgi:effector-binding domain-containing protein